MAEVQQGAPAPTQGNAFPGSKEEGKTFLLQMVKYINQDEEVVKILTESKGKDAPAAAVVGALAAQLLTLLFTKLYEQTGGEQVSADFAIEIVRVAVKEISDIADGIGWNTSVEDEAQAAQIAGDTLDQTMQELYAGGGAPPEQQAAPQAGGMMQGPPQGGM